MSLYCTYYILYYTILVNLNNTLSLEVRCFYDTLCRVLLENIMFCLLRLIMNRVLNAKLNSLSYGQALIRMPHTSGLALIQIHAHTHTHIHKNA